MSRVQNAVTPPLDHFDFVVEPLNKSTGQSREEIIGDFIKPLLQGLERIGVPKPLFCPAPPSLSPWRQLGCRYRAPVTRCWAPRLFGRLSPETPEASGAAAFSGSTVMALRAGRNSLERILIHSGGPIPKANVVICMKNTTLCSISPEIGPLVDRQENRFHPKKSSRLKSELV
jgi:hypothetical protein